MIGRQAGAADQCPIDVGDGEQLGCIVRFYRAAIKEAQARPAELAPDRLAIAYEPIWAIGTGKVPTTAEIAQMHSALRSRLVAAYGDAGSLVRILYGGSVKPSNAPEIFGVEDVDGALVGGASLKAADFLPIVAAAASAVEAASAIA